jgi:hypothetical protein
MQPDFEWDNLKLKADALDEQRALLEGDAASERPAPHSQMDSTNSTQDLAKAALELTHASPASGVCHLVFLRVSQQGELKKHLEFGTFLKKSSPQGSFKHKHAIALFKTP